jgi:hypothetical protein
VDFFELRDKGAELFTLDFMCGSLRKESGKTARTDPLANRFSEAGRKADPTTWQPEQSCRILTIVGMT